MTLDDAPLRRRSDAVEGARLRALVVDDDENYSAFVALLLKRAGFAADIACNGEEALYLLRCGRTYDLMLVDLAMPRLDGLGLIRIVRQEPATADLYAVMLTATADMETRIEALSAGFDDYLVKAVTDLELIAKIASSKRLVLRQRTAEATLRELRGLASRDALTGLMNRRFFNEEVEKLLQCGESLSIVLLDLDDFKKINDSYGHLAGDTVLCDVAEVLRLNSRFDDFVARFGGDEFVMVLRDAAVEEVERVVRRVSVRVESLRWQSEGRWFGTSFTAGHATTRFLESRELSPLLEAADRDLYKNKLLKKSPHEPWDYGYGRTAPAEVVSFPQPQDPGREQKDKESRLTQ